jgi:hypothetical protein
MKKRVLTVMVFALPLGGLPGQCLLGDCHNGLGVVLYPNAERYAGHFLEGRFHGQGIYIYDNGSQYRGEWLEGRPNGPGLKTFPDGARLEGIWEKGRLMQRYDHLPNASEYASRGQDRHQSGCISGDCGNGQGIFVLAGGAIYIGDFQNGEVHGVGTCYYADGSKYQGEWAHRLPHGKGTKTYSDGAKRGGYWHKGQPVDVFGNLIVEAPGAIAVAKEVIEVQSGCLAGDCHNGQGLFAYSDGSRYDGQFFRGKPEGWGVFQYANGEKYAGTFREGHPHGRGRLERPNGSALSGEWRAGEYLGAENPASVAGCLQGNCRNGHGVYRFKDGAKYTGYFNQDRPHGQGVVEYPNGERYEGEMAAGAFNGQGILFLANGTQVNGYWEKGAYMGPRPPLPIPSSWQNPSPSRPPSMRVWAVIIGVAAYNHMPVLRYTDDDAYRIYAFLKSPEGGALDDNQIRILIDEDATKKNILDALENTFGKAGSNDLVFLYFSGHGLKGSFLPYDYDGFNNKLLHEEINERLSRSRAKYKLCIADACHSGSLLAMRDDATPTLNAYYENLARAQPGAALIMSSKSDETSLESSGLRQGVFSHFLIRGLKGEADRDNDKIVTVKELFDFVYNNVRIYTGSRQSPVIQGDYDPNMTVSVRR